MYASKFLLISFVLSERQLIERKVVDVLSIVSHLDQVNENSRNYRNFIRFIEIIREWRMKNSKVI